MENLGGLIAEHPFFRDLKPEHIELITGCASNVRFEAGRHIFREGEEANQFFVIREGMVAIEVAATKRRPITIQTIGKGQILGWSWMVVPYRWHFDARVVELVRAIALDAACLRDKSKQDHELGYELLTRLLAVVERRLQAARMQLINIYGPET
jgi:CRP-like cAMP-binding protein